MSVIANVAIALGGAVQLPGLAAGNSSALGPAVEQLVHQLVPPPYPSHIPHAGHHPFPAKTVSAANEMVLEGMVCPQSPSPFSFSPSSLLFLRFSFLLFAFDWSLLMTFLLLMMEVLFWGGWAYKRSRGCSERHALLGKCLFTRPSVVPLFVAMLKPSVHPVSTRIGTCDHEIVRLARYLLGRRSI